MAQPSPSAILHPKPSQPTTTTTTPTTTTTANGLPSLLQTPTGLALLELQGTINLPHLPPPPSSEDAPESSLTPSPKINIGRIEFPDYQPDSLTFDPSSTAWMKRVYLYVGQHQRLTGEVRKLPRALGVVRRRPRRNPPVLLRGGQAGGGKEEEGGEEEEEELEIAEVVKYKIVFSSRPEPVGTG